MTSLPLETRTTRDTISKQALFMIDFRGKRVKVMKSKAQQRACRGVREGGRRRRGEDYKGRRLAAEIRGRSFRHVWLSNPQANLAPCRSSYSVRFDLGRNRSSSPAKTSHHRAVGVILACVRALHERALGLQRLQLTRIPQRAKSRVQRRGTSLS